MATYYIDPLAGDDDNNGTSTSTPWQNFPSKAADGTVSKAVFSAGAADGWKYPEGTVFNFRKGRTFPSGMLCWGSGNASAPVVYNGSSWGSGDPALITSNCEEGTGFICYPTGGNYQGMTFSGFKFFEIGGYSDDDSFWDEPAGGWDAPTYNPDGTFAHKGDAKVGTDLRDGTGIGLKRGARDVLVEDCEFERIGVINRVKPLCGNQAATGVGVLVGCGDNVIVRDCTFHRMRTAVKLSSSSSYGTNAATGRKECSNILVQNCQCVEWFHWVFDMSSGDGETWLTNIVFDGNEIGDVWQVNQWLPDGSAYWEGWGDSPHTDGLMFRRSNSATTAHSSGIVFRNNRLWADDITTGGTAGVFISQGGSIDVYNNVFHNAIKPVAVSISYLNYSRTTQTVRVLNNTFVGDTKCVSCSAGRPDLIIVKNNLFIRPYDNIGAAHAVVYNQMQESTDYVVISDHNCYVMNDETEDTNVVYADGWGGMTLDEWKAKTKEGSLTDQNGLCLNISDTSTIGLTNQSTGSKETWDAHLVAGSELIGAGEDLSDLGIAGLLTDKDGLTRVPDANGRWDIGAYAYNGTTSTDTTPPTADAGTDIEVQLPDTTTSLDGTGSWDAVGITSWLWTQQAGGPSTAAIADADTSTPDISLLNVPGEYVFRLTVTDAVGQSDYDDVTVTVLAVVEPDPDPPVADAGTDIEIQLPTNETALNGTASTGDPRVDSWLWLLYSAPAGMVPGITNSTTSTPTVTGLTVAGDYEFQLTVRDAIGQSDTDVVKVTVLPAAVLPDPPVADAGPDIEITLPVSTTQLDGTGSTGTITGQSWSLTEAPRMVTFDDASIMEPTITGLTAAGTYTFLLLVGDAEGQSSEDTMNVTVLPLIDEAPTADAGVDVEISLPTTIASLDGSGSSDPEDELTTYAWEFVSGPVTPSIADADTDTPDITGMTEAGTYVFELTVTDAFGLEDEDTVSVIVSGSDDPPVANAGSNQTGVPGLPLLGLATLNGESSVDGVGTTNYYWRWVSGPSMAVFDDITSLTPNVSNLAEGVHTFELMGIDSEGQEHTDTVTVTVYGPPDEPTGLTFVP